MSAQIEQPEVICEICGEVCTDDFLIYEWPGSHNGYCLCPDCHQEQYERMIEAGEFYKTEVYDSLFS